MLFKFGKRCIISSNIIIATYSLDTAPTMWMRIEVLARRSGSATYRALAMVMLMLPAQVAARIPAQ